MHTLHQIKGKPKELTSIRDDFRVLDLVTYPDGSWGILCNGVSVGVWEREEYENCIYTWAGITGFVGGEVPEETIRQMFALAVPQTAA